MQTELNEPPPYIGVLFVSHVFTHTYLHKNPIGMPQDVVQSFWLLQKDKYLVSLKKQEKPTFSYGNQALVAQMLFSEEKFVNLYETYV